jgi:hypothetical protein
MPVDVGPMQVVLFISLVLGGGAVGLGKRLAYILPKPIPPHPAFPVESLHDIPVDQSTHGRSVAVADSSPPRRRPRGQ